jgi:hypothetical protein
MKKVIVASENPVKIKISRSDAVVFLLVKNQLSWLEQNF